MQCFFPDDLESVDVTAFKHLLCSDALNEQSSAASFTCSLWICIIYSLQITTEQTVLHKYCKRLLCQDFLIHWFRDYYFRSTVHLLKAHFLLYFTQALVLLSSLSYPADMELTFDVVWSSCYGTIVIFLNF